MLVDSSAVVMVASIEGEDVDVDSPVWLAVVSSGTKVVVVEGSAARTPSRIAKTAKAADFCRNSIFLAAGFGVLVEVGFGRFDPLSLIHI